MTVSAEQLHVHTVRVPVERVRLVRRVVTETRQLQVQVRREELHVERIAVADGEAVPAEAVGGSPAGELVIVLSEEVPVLTTAVRPTERVRVSVVTVTGDRTVSADLRHEQTTLERDG